MTDDLTMPALFTALVGGDPERRVAIRSRGEGSWYGVIYPESMEWRNDVHNVRPFIPEGTPVERVVVLPEVAEVTVDTEGYWHVGDEAIGLEDRGVYPFDVRLHYALVTAAKMTKILAARAAEPTPDPLAQAREQVRRAIVRGTWPALREAADSLLAATETDR
jgi:hypothetical protein